MDADFTVDARGLLCPLPVLKARKRLLEMAPGSVLALVASDPAAIVDVPHFCLQSGHRLVATTDVEGGQMYLIQHSGAGVHT